MLKYVGRITVYSIVGCPHCKAAKARLKVSNMSVQTKLFNIFQI